MYTESGSISSAETSDSARAAPVTVPTVPFVLPGASAAPGSSSSAPMIGISPVNSATVTASVLPRRRRRRPPAGGGAPMVPLRASNSATEIGRVSWLSGPVIASRPHVVWHPLDQHPALKSPQAPFHQLRCRVSAE